MSCTSVHDDDLNVRLLLPRRGSTTETHAAPMGPSQTGPFRRKWENRMWGHWRTSRFGLDWPEVRANPRIACLMCSLPCRGRDWASTQWSTRCNTRCSIRTWHVELCGTGVTSGRQKRRKSVAWLRLQKVPGWPLEYFAADVSTKIKQKTNKLGGFTYMHCAQWWVEFGMWARDWPLTCL